MIDECLAIIPARGGSKRVPGKNIRMLGGRPALEYSVTAALESGLFSRVIVTTDDAQISEIARGCGAEVPFIRESSLADDFAPVSHATTDALERVDADKSCSFVAQLMPNCPLRTAADIGDSFQQFRKTDADTQISITPYGWMNPWWAVRTDSEHRMEHILPEALGKRSQDLPEVFCPSGAIWWAKSDVLRRERDFHIPGKRGWNMPWQRALDIDSEDDWLMAEMLLRLSREKSQ